MNKKRILLALSSGAVAVTLIPMFAAFEAHVINVTAKIENALAVSTNAIDFGTVFPQEHLEQPLTIRLSGSFLEEDRVDDVEYFIRQKPKCAITNADGTQMLDKKTKTGHIIVDNGQVRIDCGEPPRVLTTGEVWGVLPSLCPYISKEEDLRPDNDESLASFHHPWTISTTTLPATIIWNDTHGRLAKSDHDLEDIWTIDLAVPCFGNHCAQDWEEFVRGINPDALPADQWVLPIEDEHKIFGCDLWVEVSEVSETPDQPTTGTLTVTKVVTNDNGGTGINTDFSFKVDGGSSTAFEADGSNAVVVAAGAHSVVEDSETGYATTYSNSLNGNADCNNLVVPVAGNVTCTITNNDVVGTGTITVTKTVVNDNGGTALASGFPLFLNGKSITSAVATTVPAGTYTVSETGMFGYSATFSGDCLANGSVTIPSGGNVACTVTNNDIQPVITLIKTVVGGTAQPDDFDISIDDLIVTSGSSNGVTANAAHKIGEEVLVSGYTFTSITGVSFKGVPCPAALDGTITLAPGDTVTCTITNTKTL